MGEGSADISALRTLIVGDNSEQRREIGELLAGFGVREVMAAEDAVAAFAQLVLRRPALIIADGEMRPFGALALARELRDAEGPGDCAAIVLVTHERSPAFADAARAAGIHEVLAKPVSAEALRACLVGLVAPPSASAPAYTGPERRSASSEPYLGVDRRARTRVLSAIDEALAHVARWSGTGDTAGIGLAREAVERAHEHADAAGADPALVRALAGAVRLADAASLGRADPHVLAASLKTARSTLTDANARAPAVAEAAHAPRPGAPSAPGVQGL